jgi:3-hydroxy-9,10-secoandrosta-1,3,5(10)-triene-9,17-dione monooxygenase reductase component
MGTVATFDGAEFRKALGSFATGVTIITTRGGDGAPVGLTVNSFNSVSLNPPLVLWSLAETSMSLPAFRDASHFAVHVLATDQEDLSGRFARRGHDKFSGLDVEIGAGDVPLLRGCSARFECKTQFQYQGGDHTIFVGEVVAFSRSETAPLVFHGGRYAHATRRDAPDAKPGTAFLSGSFSEDFLGYLLGRGHFEFFGRIRPLLEEMQLSDVEFYALSTLTLKRELTAAEIQKGLSGVPGDGSAAAVQSLIVRGLVQGSDATAYRLTAAGSEVALRIISAAKAVEVDVLERLGTGESAALKTLLNRLIHVIDPQIDALWKSDDDA